MGVHFLYYTFLLTFHLSYVQLKNVILPINFEITVLKYGIIPQLKLVLAGHGCCSNVTCFDSSQEQ